MGSWYSSGGKLMPSSRTVYGRLGFDLKAEACRSLAKGSNELADFTWSSSGTSTMGSFQKFWHRNWAGGEEAILNVGLSSTSSLK